MKRMLGWLCILVLPLVCMVQVGCSGEPTTPLAKLEAIPGTSVYFDTSGKWKEASQFFNFPFPSDLRLTSSGGPDFTGFPNPRKSELVASVLNIVARRPGFPVIPIVSFRFRAPVAKGDLKKPMVSSDSPVLLMDVDPDSKERGKLYPVVAAQHQSGVYVPDFLLTVAAYPGVVLPAGRTFAVIVMRSWKDAKGKPLGVPKAVVQLRAGQVPEGALGEKIKALYDPVWETLKNAKIDPAKVAAATVFTTGDVVQQTADMAAAVRKQYSPSIKDLKLDPDDGDHPRYCELHGTITMPGFQQGTPPYDKQGTFLLDKDGVPVKQRDVKVPVVVNIPRGKMPADGFKLMVYVHGSGGLSGEVVNRGLQSEPKGPKKKGEGPAHVVAARQIASASLAMPLNPERFQGAGDFSYLNLQNLSAFPDTFRQGVLEARLFLDALLKLRISPEVFGKCKGVELPAGVKTVRFSEQRIALMGQSMGAMYTNMIAAIEPRYQAVVPTGAGGYWSFFALNSNVAILQEPLLRALLEAKETLTFTHPLMTLINAAWEAAEPLAHIPRLSRRPLKGHPVRHVYQPIGKADSYFPEVIMDIFALGYQNQQAGSEVWPETQERLGVVKLDGLANYPVKLNRSSENSSKRYTGVVAQYDNDPVSKDGHMIAFQLDAVKYQYACFVYTFLKTGTPTVPAPASDPKAPCPE